MGNVKANYYIHNNEFRAYDMRKIKEFEVMIVTATWICAS